MLRRLFIIAAIVGIGGFCTWSTAQQATLLGPNTQDHSVFIPQNATIPAQSGGAPHFTVSSFKDGAILLDTESGDTWSLRDREGTHVWIAIKRDQAR
jgi:hypothetical protein